MTNEQAKSELMQIYMSLSEEKKKALDVLMAQTDGEYQTKKSCETCKYSETFNLDCARCDDDMTNYAPKQADGEYISRQAVLDITWEEPSYTDALNVLTEVRDKIKALPSVKQEPKTGWHIAHGMCEDRFWCSCGYIRIMDSGMNKWKFCPGCGGARMVEPQEGANE